MGVRRGVDALEGNELKHRVSVRSEHCLRQDGHRPSDDGPSSHCKHSKTWQQSEINMDTHI